jgi:hypothetical protein
MNTALKKPLALLLIVALLLSAAVPAFSVPAQHKRFPPERGPPGFS